DALVLRERALPQPACCTQGEHVNPGLPELPVNEAPSLPSLFKSKPPATDLPDRLPPPKPVEPGKSQTRMPEMAPTMPVAARVTAPIQATPTTPALAAPNPLPQLLREPGKQ